MTQEFKVGDQVQRKESAWTWQSAGSHPQLPKGGVFNVTEYIHADYYPSISFEHTGNTKYDAAFFELVEENAEPQQHQLTPKYYIGTRLIRNLDSAKVKADLKDNGWNDAYWKFLNGNVGTVIFVAEEVGVYYNYQIKVDGGGADWFWISQDEDIAVEYDGIKELGPVETQEGPIKSDGGSSSYYDLEVPEWLIDNLTLRDEEGKCFIKTEEMITAFFSNDFDYGNLLKCLVRVHGTQIGTGGKAGNSVDYECNKMNYSVEKIRGKK